MKKTLIATAVAATVVAPISALAVNVAHNGTGEVLLYPYYNVNQGNVTFFTITNTTAQGKALKVRFREGVESEDILDFQVWMSPHDHWSAVIARDGSNISVNTNDTTCTVPTVGNNSVALFNSQRIPPVYTGSVPDRMSEGHIEVIEMAEVQNDPTLPTPAWSLLTAITHVNGVPADCAMPAAFNDAQAIIGLPILNPANVNLNSPTGGLYGLAAVFNPTDGTYFTYSAEALEQFAATPIFYPQTSAPYPPGADHTADDSLTSVLFFDLPDVSTPDGIEGSAGANTINSQTFTLNGATTLGTYITDGVAVPIAGPPVNANATYKKRDAVTTALMAYRVDNDYLTGSLFDTDWVFTFPGRYLYRGAINQTTLTYPMAVPFQSTVDRTTGQGCEQFSSNILYGREEEQLISSNIGFSPGLTPDVFSLCYEVNVIAMNDDGDGTYTAALASQAVRADASSNYPYGWADLILGAHSLADDAATTHVGLPVIGFAGVTDRSQAVTRGGTFMHKITRGITSAMVPTLPF